MGTVSYGNLDTREGNLNGTLAITFNWKPRRIIITNDSTSNDLSFKFNDSETYATLKPTETITLDMASKTMTIQGTNIPYRVWGIG